MDGPPPLGIAKSSTEAIDGRRPMIEKVTPKTCHGYQEQILKRGKLSVYFERGENSFEFLFVAKRS
jgi:hypothetical protein